MIISVPSVRFLILVLPLSLVVSLGSATAQPPDDAPERQAAARALFEEGLEHLRAERWDEAADRFERAHALRPSAEIAYNLSSALIRLGRLVRASELLRQVAQSPQAPDRVRAAAESRLEQVLPRLARLTVRIDGPSDRLVVTVDGRTLDRAMIGVAFPIDPGSHTVEASRAGQRVYERTLDVVEGGAVEATVRVAPLAATPAPPGATSLAVRPDAEPERTPRAPARWWLWALGAAVAAGVATAVVVASSGGRAQPERGNVDTIFITGR